MVTRYITIRQISTSGVWLEKVQKYHQRRSNEGHYTKEGNVLYNDALNTFYFTVIWRRTYGKGPL